MPVAALAFEFGFGRYVSRLSWQALLATLVGPWLWGLVVGRPRR